jgi:hypothetical protein
MAIPSLKGRIPDAAAKRRAAASSAPSVYASAFSHTAPCVISNGDAYRFSPYRNPIFSRGDR